MANVWFLGDAHRGHKNIHKYRPKFASLEEHDDYVKEQYHRVVTKRDLVFFMGDAAFTHEALADIAKWPGTKYLIVGNHDQERGITMDDLLKTYDEVYGFRKYKEFWLSHAPIHPRELRGKVNIHGHVHGNTVPDEQYFNTSLENIDYRPVDLQTIRDTIRYNLERSRLNYESSPEQVGLAPL